MNAELIQSDLAVLMGKPIVVGTRIRVELILEKLNPIRWESRLAARTCKGGTV